MAASPGRRSAGILLYRTGESGVEVLLVHPGGPFWARRDAGAWSIPKGEHASEESPWLAAVRELKEETGLDLPADGPRLELGEVRQAGGKRVVAFAVADVAFDPADLRSNGFSIEWPPRSGRMAEFPEVDRAAWFALDVAGEKILAGQRPLLDRLAEALGVVP